MQKSNDDCYYFLTSSCAKGSACNYRHNSAVLTCNIMCPAWLRGNCIDPNCQLRHSAIQRPNPNNVVSCYYENTSMGCLKLDCPFAHLRPRPTLRSSSIVRSPATNLVNKDIVKSTANTNPSSTPPSVPPPVTSDPVSTPQVEPLQTSTAKVEVPVSNEISSSANSSESVSSRTTDSTENRQTDTSNVKTVTESSDDTRSKTTATVTQTQTRMVANRNVVIAESSNSSNRKIVQGTTNRIVVSSDKISSKKEIMNDSDSDSDLDDLVKQAEIDSIRTNTVIDISFPCSAPSITNRFLTSTKPTTVPNDTKPIRLNRDHLPALKTTITNTSNSNSTSSNGEKKSAGTELSQEDERRASRIERFKNSIPRPVANTSSSPSLTSTRNVIASSKNERKRPLEESSTKETQPPKRRSFQQENNQPNTTTTIGDLCPSSLNSRRISDRHRRRSSPSPSSSSSSSSSSSPSQRKSSPRPIYPSKSSMDDSTWKRQVDEFLARTAQPKPSTSLPLIPSQPVPLFSIRPRFIPPPPQQYQQRQKSMIPRYPSTSQRPRRPSTNPVKPTPPPVVNNSTTPAPSKPAEQTPTTSTTTNPPPTSENEEDENKLLELDESADVVDTFALIDEALFETDHLLELM